MWDIIVFLCFVFVTVTTVIGTCVYLFFPEKVRETSYELSRRDDAEIIRRVWLSVPIILLLLEFWRMTGW
jgi:hypothetical protein